MLVETILAILLWMVFISLTTAALVMFVCVFGILLGFLLWPYAMLTEFFAYLFDIYCFSKEKVQLFFPVIRRVSLSHADCHNRIFA